MLPELGTFAIVLALCFAMLQGLGALLSSCGSLKVSSSDSLRSSSDSLTSSSDSLTSSCGPVDMSSCGLTAGSRERLDPAVKPQDDTIKKAQDDTIKKPQDDTIKMVQDDTFKIETSAVFGQFLFLCFAMLCLILSFINNDLTVIYVREHSHALLPLLYRIGAAWGGHEGSLLLWCVILSGWTGAFTLFADKKIPSSFFNKILMVLGFVSAGFIIFLLFTSNPFQRDFPSALIVGDDLTPILQDPGLIFHPPMLYLGYVGFAIGFAFAIAALLEKQFSAETARACRPWIILPWSFLSCGIVLGSWWAYRELGWGGWWFWDPVENASLLPWLSATALIHSLIVTEKRQVFKGWTILLCIVTFTLSLLGTFLVRSGVLVSVHAFASDPTRGLFLLVYLAAVIGSALLLYAARIKYFYQAPRFELFSRETFLLINSVFLLSAVATIVIGTLYPIILDAMELGKISVGEPYFNTVFLPIILPLLFFMAFAPHVRWSSQSLLELWKKIRMNFLITLLVGFVAPMLMGFEFHFGAAIGTWLGLWIITSTLQYAAQLWRAKHTIALKHWAMIVAHIGIAITVLGITLNKSYSEERQIKMLPGDSITLAGYLFTFKKMEDTQGPNYTSMTGTFGVKSKWSSEQELIAQERIYTSHEQSLSKPGILFNPWRDLYLALGNSLPDGGWSIRIYYKPFVRWIWAGGFLLLAGGLLSLLNYLRMRGNDNENA
jgi:cytochrome c-type biogenesis protein CcmF